MAPAAKKIAPPMVKWAQRPNLVFVTICLEDCNDPTIKVEADKLYFKGVGGPEKLEHEVTMEFFKEIDTEKSKYAVRAREIEFALEKKEAGPYWDRLLKEKLKQHWLKIDFMKWKDEDDSDEEAGGAGGADLEEMMRSMGGMGGLGGMGGGAGGMGGMAGMGDMSELANSANMARPNLDDLDSYEDSDDEDLPDLE